jgi:hypothetical protein
MGCLIVGPNRAPRPGQALELAAHRPVVARKQLRPAVVAHLADALGRSDDVGEEHRCEHTVALRRGPDPGHELLYLVQDRVPVLRQPGVVGARERDEARARDVRSDVAALLDVRIAIRGPMHHDRRHADRREDVAHVDERVHLHQGQRRPPGSRTFGSSARSQRAPRYRDSERCRPTRAPSSSSAPRRRTHARALPNSAPRDSPGFSAASLCSRTCTVRSCGRGRSLRRACSCCRPRRRRRRRRARTPRRPSPRTSSIRCSSVGSSRADTGSDMPVPRLSKRIRREKDASRSKPPASSGSSQASSTWETQPGT